MARTHAVSDGDLLRLIDEEIAGGVSFENDLTANGDRRTGSAKGDRETALEYFDGVVRDLPHEKGRSSVVSRDVSDIIGTMLPGLMRVFDGSDRVAVYSPARPGDEKGADQATDYVNYVWANDCDGYLILLTWILDALQVRNGIVKAYWDPTPETEAESFTGLSDEQLVILFDDPDVEVVGYDAHPQMVQDPATGQPMPLQLHDVKIRRRTSSGRLVIENVPPEDFGISRRAKSIDKARCVWHRTKLTRSDLLKQGYKRDLVWSLPTSDGAPAETIDREQDAGVGAEGSGANTEIDIVEAYVFADCDGDGIAESRKVVTAGGAGGRKILKNEEWSDDRPFADLIAQAVPHRWMGRSIADDVMDQMRVKTSLWRGVLDNTYAQNRPQREAVQDDIINPDEVLNPTFGGVIRVKKAGAVRDVITPQIADKILVAIQAVDGVLQRRTGVSGATASLDATALEPQTATAEQLEHDASYARVELIARNMAKLGVKKLFAKILRIIVRNQDRPRTIRLRDQWVEFDPRAWNAGMDVEVNIGMGTGSRERDLTMLAGVAARQEKIIEQLGPDNPVVTPSMYVKTLHKMVEASGLKAPETYFADVSDEDFAKWMASRPQQQDPRAQADVAKIQAQVQGDQQKIAAQIQGDRTKAEASMQIERERMVSDEAMERDRVERDFALRREEMSLEAQLKGTEILAGMHTPAQTNIPRHG